MASLPSKEDSHKKAKYASMFLSASVTAVTHPIQMTKVMIQVGYEPIAPVPYKNIFGKQMYKLPGLFTYASTIYQVDGFLGLFRGVTPRIASAIIGSSISNSMMDHLHSLDKNNDSGPQQSRSENTFEEFARETCYQSISKVTSIIVTYPLQVVSMRMIIQFIGRETKYTGIIQSFREIYNEEGISGLFSGLIPQIIGDLLTLWMFRGLTFGVNKAVASEVGDFSDVKTYTQHASQIMVSSLTYPFVLVANLMSVKECRFLATSKLPKFDGWMDCMRTLRKHRILWRGSSVFRRTSPINDIGPLSFRKTT